MCGAIACYLPAMKPPPFSVLTICGLEELDYHSAQGGGTVFGQLDRHAVGVDGAPHGRLARLSLFRRLDKGWRSRRVLT